MNLVVWLTLYFSGFAFFTWACILADPDKSSVANLLTVKIPNAIVSRLRRVLSPKMMGVLNTGMEYSLVLVYLVLVLGCWSITFTFCYDLVTASSHVSNLHKYVGYVVFVACMTSWRLASRSSPGYITSRTLPKYDNYPYDGLLFHDDKICPTVKIRKLARSKYDRFSGAHVARFDHFCGWINNPVGQENYRWFLLFLAVHVGMCTYGTVVLCWLFAGEIEDGDLLNATFFVVGTGEEVRASKWVVMQFLISRHFYLFAAFAIMAVMAVTLGLFLGFHLYISAKGMTTNEYYKWKEVKKWHKRARQRYEQAKKEGLLTTEAKKKEEVGVTTSASKAVSDDVDMGCVGPTNAGSAGGRKGSAVAEQNGRAGTDEQEDDDDDEAILDPGPFPKNIYNRGIWENFSEIIYPLSLREDALARWREFLRNGGGKASVTKPEAVIRDKPKAI